MAKVLAHPKAASLGSLQKNRATAKEFLIPRASFSVKSPERLRVALKGFYKGKALTQQDWARGTQLYLASCLETCPKLI